MIRANTRGRLTPADLQLVILLLSRGSAHKRAYIERRLASEGPDTLLDTPELLERLLTVRTMLVPSEALFFYVLVRHALCRSGVDDRDLADYLAALLLDELVQQSQAAAPQLFESLQRPASLWRLQELLWLGLRQTITGLLSLERIWAALPLLARYLCDAPRKRSQKLTQARRVLARLGAG